MLRILTICASVLAVAATCGNPELIPPPQDPEDAVFDELEGTSCPATSDWYWNVYDPWADARCRAEFSDEECGTHAGSE